MVRGTFALVVLLVITVPALHADEEVRQPLKPGVVAPDFTATTLDGVTLRLADWRGKVVVLNYFITWYRDAAKHLKMMEDLNTAFSERGMRLVSISLDEGSSGLDEVRTLIREEGIAHPVIVDPEQHIAAAYGVRALPAIFVIGRDGIIVYYHEGYTEGDEERLGEVIAAALNIEGEQAEAAAASETETETAAATEESEEPVCKCFRRSEE